ncbi:MAG: rhomboid family intramembrane serine protease [Candidatus Aenigmarchaeota archaeon]|nr:rhomboid family intramembrane serine protease [Candidatus Aenigmarchaeota archaeon]
MRRIVFGSPRRISFWDTITSKILTINIVVFILTSFSQSTFDLLALTPTTAIQNGMIWQFVSFMFVHANFAHIFFNMFSLLMFGPTIENRMGTKKYLIFYMFCGLGSGLFHILITGLGDVPLVGASGAIFGVVTAYGLFFPRNVIYVYFVPMPAIVAIGLFALIELFSGISGAQAGVANFGHLGGMIIGLILVKFFKFGKQKEHTYFWESDW